MTSVVTGAFGYIGRYIARHLLQQGETVRTITTHPDKPNPFGDTVQAHPYDFERPEQLVAHLRGASTLYNTYWVRFERGDVTFERAVQNTATLFACAKEAGVEKIVHISVTNASAESALPYYAGKGRQEQALAACGVPFAVVRPTLVFGSEDILVNNIAWLLRTFPVFPVFGSGDYRVQPIFVEDLAAIAVQSAREAGQPIRDALGPESFTFRELVERIASEVSPRVLFVSMPPALGIALGRLIGLVVRDVVLTLDEAHGLMSNLLTSAQLPNGSTRFSDWLKANRRTIGAAYTSELARHFRWRRGA